jgi:hypothetical protein
MSANSLTPHNVGGGEVSNEGAEHYRLTIPENPKGNFRLAQLDDYTRLSRRRFPWRPPLTISLQARSSHPEIPGTHGFGVWNDPFSFSLGFGSENLLPALPNAAWFFFASSPNHLSFRDDLPANGALAATFRSPRIPTWLASPGLIGIPLLMIPPAARLVRKIASRVILQDAVQLNHNPTEWHSYRINWQVKTVSFFLDEQIVLSTDISPQGPLGFVLWIDNQYAAWTPEGRMKYGTLPTPSDWLEVKDLTIQPDAPE